jgi:DNA-binding transcriptional MerR regulator
MPSDAEFSIADLARLTGVNVRTIRYWIAQGLIPASGEVGPGAHYGQGHLDRLTLVKRLQGEYLPNAEIRRRLEPLSDAEVASLLRERPATDPDRPTTTALEYVRGVLGESGVVPIENRLDRFTWNAADLEIVPMPAVSQLAEPSLPFPPPAAPAARTAGSAQVVGRIAELREAPTVEQETPMPERSQWERLSLGPNIELHVRRPLSRPEQRKVERLITIARQVLDDDKA